MKRNISIILVLSIVLSMFSLMVQASPTETSDENFSNKLTILKDTGIIKSDFYTKGENETITRGEFSNILTGLINLSVDGSMYSEKFSDVNSETKYFADIMALCNLSYLNGYSDNTFLPEKEITGEEALKVLIQALGYKYKAVAMGGYPTGYLTAANNLGLLKGVKIYTGRSITFLNLVKLIYNSLDVPIAKVSGVGSNGEATYTIKDNENILTEYHKMQITKGLVTANELVGIKLNSETPEDTISVDGVIYGIKDIGNINLVGSEVILIYDIDKERKSIYNNIISVVKDSDKTKEVTYDISDIISEQNRKVTFEDENEKSFDIVYKGDADIIYNGERGSITSDFFMNLNQGTVKFISTDNSNSYDVIIVNDFKTMVVDNMDKVNKKVTGMFLKEDGTKDVLNLNNKDKKTVIKDIEGNIVNYEFISTGDILTYADNKNYAFVTVGGATTAGDVKEVSKDGDSLKLIIGENQFEFNKEAYRNHKGIKSGDYLRLQFDAFNKVAYVVTLNKDGFTKNFLLKLGEKQIAGEPQLSAKLYDMEKGVITLKFAENVKVDGYLIKNINKAKFEAKLNGITEQLIGIKVNDNKEIIDVLIAKNLKYLEDNNMDGFCRTHKLTVRQYYEDPPTFNRAIIANGGTTFLMIPEKIDEAKDEDFKVVPLSYLENSKNYNMEAYNSTKDYTIPEYIIIRDNASAPGFVTETAVVVVKDIVNTITKDGERVKKITVQNGSKEDFYYIGENQDKKDIPKCEKTGILADQVKKGDVIRFTKDGNDFVGNFEIRYRDNKKTEGLDFDSKKNRTIDAVVARKTEDYIFIPHWYEDPNELYGGFSVKEQTIKIGGITVVEEREGRAPVIRGGAVSDIEKGDRVIVHIAYAQLIGIIVYK